MRETPTRTGNDGETLGPAHCLILLRKDTTGRLAMTAQTEMVREAPGSRAIISKKPVRGRASVFHCSLFFIVSLI